MMPTQPVRDRSAARQQIRERLDQLARDRGYRDHIDESDHDYEEWQKRAGLHQSVDESYSSGIRSAHE